jgi:hypothetical protein
MENKFKHNILNKWIKEDVLSKLKSFLDLLQLDQEMAKKRITVNSLPGQKADIDRDETRPWHVIPNIRRFGITLMPYDWLLLIFGLFKKYESSKEFWTWRNSNSNNYIDYMFKRLRKEVKLKEYNRAKKTMWILMNSEAYQVSALNHVLRNWHRHLKWINVKRTLQKVRRLCKTRDHNIEFSRVYIPKSEDDPSKGVRPLGVPKWEWRIYLHMYNNLLVEWRSETEGENQHGYLPQRGVITAWKRLAELLTEMPNIYEADFKGFFDSINLRGLSEVLEEHLGMPEEEAIFIRLLNQSLVKLRETDEMKEPERDVSFVKDGTPNVQSKINLIGGQVILKAPDWEGKMNSPTKKVDFDDWREPLLKHWETGELYEPSELIHVRSKERASDLWGIFPVRDIVKTHGVPQGAPTSCSLATLAFRPLEAKMDKPYPADSAKWVLVDHKDLEVHKYTELAKIKNMHAKAVTDLKDYRSQFELVKELGPDEYLSRYSYFPSRIYLEQFENRVKYLSELIGIIEQYRGKGKIVFYADDVVYFPHDSKEDPVSVLENNKLGIKVNLSKSDWIKREGMWLKDSIKFLGMRYYPSRKITFNDVKLEDIMIIFGLCYSLDVILFSGWPIFLALGLLSQGPVLYYRTQERFVAETRKGATLEFSSKESFISWLDVMRDGILSGSIDPDERERIIKGGVKAWLDEEYGDWKRWATTRRVKWLWRTKLIGYFFSRMQADSWHISIEQDFRLKPVSGSWIWECWPVYANKWGLENRELNVFNASSFACNDLMDWLRRLKQLKRNKKSKVRYVFTKASSRKRRTAATNSTERAMKGLFKSRSSSNPATGV